MDIIGDDFRSVDDVRINDIPAPDVIVLSKNRLLAQLPDILQTRTESVQTVLVTSRRLTVTPRSLIKFRISDSPGKVRGILRLIQKFLKILLGTPGTDIFNRNTGGGPLKNIGEVFGKDEGGGIVSDLVISVDQTSRQLIALQSRDARLPRDERLLSARVSRANFNRELSALLASIELTSQAGRAATANLEF